MTILTAGLKSNVYDAARDYLASGTSIIPVSGKKPTLRFWKMYQTQRPSMAFLDQWQKAGLLTGIAVICGGISGNLAVIDLDNTQIVEEFRRTFPHLTHTYTVLSGSRRGAHFYYYVNQLPASTLLPGIVELRCNGHYVVAPPSIHPTSGLAYIVETSLEPLCLYNLNEVVSWINSKRPAPEKKLPAPKSPTARPVGNKSHASQRDEFFKRLYVQSALDKQLRILRNATEGQRNDLLLVSAIALGQLVGARALDRSKAEKELYTAAMQVGLEQKETLATIKSGLDIGEKSPRNIPPAPPKLSNQN